MHFVRRAALRAASSSPSASFVAKSRSITTSPFALRSKASIAQSIPRRFYSEEKSSQDAEKSTVGDAVDAVKEKVSEVAESAKGAFESATEAATQATESATRAASEYAPRGFSAGRDEDRGFGRRFNNERNGDSGDRRGRSFDRPAAQPNNKIYVGNLLFDVTVADLEREFAAHGKVTRAIIATDDRGLSKGFGYVHFETLEEAAGAIEAKHQSVFEGRRMVVNYMNSSTSIRPSTNEPSKTLFIGNIPFEMSDADLNKLFRDVKNVIDVRVAIDRRTGQPRGFAHADFKDVESAVAGKEALFGKELYGRSLRVDYSAGARERREREPRERREE